MARMFLACSGEGLVAAAQAASALATGLASAIVAAGQAAEVLRVQLLRLELASVAGLRVFVPRPHCGCSVSGSKATPASPAILAPSLV